MRLLMLSYHDIEGGAARAAYRLLGALRGEGLDATMLVQRRASADPAVAGPSPLGRAAGRLALALDKSPLLLYPRRARTDWGLNWAPRRTLARARRRGYDLVHLHWVSGALLPVYDLAALGAPIVWTLHDMWALTGGCHYDQGCGRYRVACGACPLLGSGADLDITRALWLAKRLAWRGLPLTVVAPSRWMAACASASPLLQSARVVTIPNGLDLGVFRPGDRAAARERFGLPQGKRLILFGAVGSTSSPRKGFRYLREALGLLRGRLGDEDLALAVFGAAGPGDELGAVEAHYLGDVSDEAELARLYAAADLFVAPSTQENLANTVMEALACGVPAVAFAVGGMPDLIEHGATGYLARPLEVEDLARGLHWVLADEARRGELGRRARRKAEAEFDARAVARRHLDLYASLLPGGLC